MAQEAPAARRRGGPGPFLHYLIVRTVLTHSRSTDTLHSTQTANMADPITADQQKMQKAVEEMQALSKEAAKLAGTISKYDAQLQENEGESYFFFQICRRPGHRSRWHRRS